MCPGRFISLIALVVAINFLHLSPPQGLLVATLGLRAHLFCARLVDARLAEREGEKRTVIHPPSRGQVAPQGTGLTVSDRMTAHDRPHPSQNLDQLDSPVPLVFAVYAARHTNRVPHRCLTSPEPFALSL
jgi:hypothetical protein